MSIKLPQYSIIIPTYNRVKTLALTLDSVCNQTLYPEKYEIIVIDDGSTDNTQEFVLDFTKKHSAYTIKYFYQKNAGPAKARNRGIKESKGEIIFFTDDDCVAPKNWMETLLDGYRRCPDVVGVGGSYYKPFDKSLDNGYFHKYINKYIGFVDKRKNDYMFVLENKTNLFNYNLAGNTANMSYKKEILEEVGGFDENLYFAGAVDMELAMNILERRYYILYIPFMVSHLKNYNLINFFKRSFNQGRGRYYMSLKYPNLSFHFTFFKFLRKILFYEYNDIKFFPAYFVNVLAFFIGHCYAKHIKQFKNSNSVKELEKSDTKIFSVERRNIKNNTIITTRFSKFNKSAISSHITKSSHNFFSIIVPTYNRARSLINALSHLIKQTIPKNSYEIIIIDDGSTDDTEFQISSFKLQVKSPEIRYFKISNAGPAKARNRGIKESKGEIIFFTDDDCVAPKNWMETLLDGYRRCPDVVGVGGWHIPPDGELEKSATSRFIHFVSFYNNPFNRSLLFSEIVTNDPMMFFDTFVYNTANVCYKKEVLQKVGGFREDFYWPGSEDNELAFRIASAGHQLLYMPFHVIHPKAMSLAEFTKLHFRRGANGYLLRTMHRELLEKIKPGFVKNYGSMSSFISRLSGPEKFLALLEWLSINAGIRYMKNKLNKN